MDKKISELDEKTSLSVDDEIIIVDKTPNPDENKRVTVQTLDLRYQLQAIALAIAL